MNTADAHQFEPGRTYLVSHRETVEGGTARQTPRVRRIFKRMERRLGEIPCAVFTSKVSRSTVGKYDAVRGTLTISGKRVPVSELSIPHYDLLTAEAV